MDSGQGRSLSGTDQIPGLPGYSVQLTVHLFLVLMLELQANTRLVTYRFCCAYRRVPSGATRPCETAEESKEKMDVLEERGKCTREYGLELHPQELQYEEAEKKFNSRVALATTITITPTPSLPPLFSLFLRSLCALQPRHPHIHRPHPGTPQKPNRLQHGLPRRL